MNGHVASTAPEAPAFFTLAARYQIAPGATVDSLLNDATCLLEGASVLANDVAADLDRSQLYTLTYLIEMAKNVVREGLRQYETKRGAQ